MHEPACGYLSFLVRFCSSSWLGYNLTMLFVVCMLRRVCTPSHECCLSCAMHCNHVMRKSAVATAIGLLPSNKEAASFILFYSPQNTLLTALHATKADGLYSSKLCGDTETSLPWHRVLNWYQVSTCKQATCGTVSYRMLLLSCMMTHWFYQVSTCKQATCGTV